MVFLFFIFMCLFGYSSSQISPTGGFRKLFDQSSVIFSLKNYSIFDPNGQSIESIYSLSPSSTVRIFVVDIPDNIQFVVMQAHSYLMNVTLSYDKSPVLNTSITGTNIGLVKMKETSSLSFYLTFNSSVEEVDVMLATQAYGADAPIPGGCNMEFQVEVSPYLRTTYDDSITEVDFAPAAPPVSALPNILSFLNSECNIKPSPVEHVMYYQFFPERDFSKETYFDKMKSMMTRSRILKNSVLVKEKPMSPPLRRIFASYPGTGNAFVVIAYFRNNSAVYVPSFTYTCNDLKENNTCLVLTTIFSKVLCAIVLFMGLFACYFGHFFFNIQIFLLGFLIGAKIIYILVSILFSPSFALSSSVAAGFFIAVLQVLARSILCIPIVSATLASLTFGYLLSSIIFYSISDYVESLVLDINYWGIIIGVMVACPIVMIPLADKANIASCAFLGSYIATLSIDYYIGSNLRYIFLNTIRRAIDEKFKWAIVGPPFQMNDIGLCVLWAILCFSGFGVQRRLTKNKPPYPPPPVNTIKSFMGILRGPSSYSVTPSETSPLLYT